MVDQNCDETEKSRVKQKTRLKIKDAGRELTLVYSDIIF